LAGNISKSSPENAFEKACWKSGSLLETLKAQIHEK
jgi:hypothetical protein